MKTFSFKNKSIKLIFKLTLIGGVGFKSAVFFGTDSFAFGSDLII